MDYVLEYFVLLIFHTIIHYALAFVNLKSYYITSPDPSMPSLNSSTYILFQNSGFLLIHLLFQIFQTFQSYEMNICINILLLNLHTSVGKHRAVQSNSYIAFNI
jgi:hypothetical protein